ncbi:SpoIIE family protein phosphatase [Streptomyces fructofermentans]|uniref:protein-serine/threonine phosphatase n=1 Tax=Streptomyces fructofermentans TaxID=152141 RepID=A0A918KNM7_9ACTN|nr:SpoIIE family protein phosphatase [Streptomyces fructofermentans]GGX69992.1 diguanylate cyclase [Streptomyces fructofermentans]
MTGSAEHRPGTSGRLDTLLTDVIREALSAAGGFAGGVYMRSSTPGLLRLAVLSGLPGRLFRPWSRLHVDRRFPVADAYRLGVQVVLPDAAETMSRYPQFATGLPFQFGSLHAPVAGERTTYGVLTVLRPAVSDATDVLPDRDRLAQLAENLGSALEDLEASGGTVAWDGEPLCVRPPAPGSTAGRIGRFTWNPATDEVTTDHRLHAVLGVAPGQPTTTSAELAGSVTAADAHHVLTALRETAAGRPPPLPLHVRSVDGAPRLVELWTPFDASVPRGAHPVHGLVLDPDIGSVADAGADLLPEGVFCLDRLGLIVYSNPTAAHLLGRSITEMLGRSLWEALPWLDRPGYEDHLRKALLSPDPVHFHVVRPLGQDDRGTAAPPVGDSLMLSVYPGPGLLTCKVVPTNRAADTSAGAPLPYGRTPHEAPAASGAHAAEGAAGGAGSMAPLYRPIVLAIALTEAVTAHQVSAVVMQELLPAFGGGRLAIYLLQEQHLYLAWETGFPKGFLDPFEGVGLDVRLPGVETLTKGQPLFFESMDQLAAEYPGIPLDTTQGARAFLPLIASGRPVGSCILGFDLPRRFSTEERMVLSSLAGLIAHAMEKAHRYDNEAALARGLQQALLPRRLSAHPRVETAGRYLAGTQGMDVGGDWYDVVESGDGLALVIGDVQGHGVQAAATMGQLRSAVRAFALGDHPPDEVMSGTNHLLIDLDPGQFASCCYIRLDPVTGLARVARAGHPPPIIRYPDGRTHVLDIPGGVVLGVDPNADYPVTDLEMEPGAILALYTDGLVERPGADIDDGITALRVALAAAGAPATHPGGRSLAGIADRLTARARHDADRPDDIALLLTTRRQTPRTP